VDIDNLAVLLQHATSTASGRVLKSGTRAGYAETEDRNAIQNTGSEPSSLWSGGIGDVHDVLHSVEHEDWILRAYKGVQGRTANVTELLRNMQRENGLQVMVKAYIRTGT
jgi:hypothetical protein